MKLDLCIYMFEQLWSRVAALVAKKKQALKFKYRPLGATSFEIFHMFTVVDV